MKIPFDKKYLKVSLYVVFTLGAAYALIMLINALVYSFVNVSEVAQWLGGFIGKLFSVLAPLIIGLIAAYILDPVVTFFQTYFDTLYQNRLEGYFEKYRLPVRHKPRSSKKIARSVYKRRTAGVVITYLLFVFILALLFLILFMRLGGGNWASFIADLSASAKKTADDFGQIYSKFTQYLKEWGVWDYVSKYFNQAFESLSEFLQGMLSGVISGITNAGSTIMSYFLGFVIAFYFLKDKEEHLARANDVMDTFIPKKWNRSLRHFLGDIHAVFSGYIHGQVTDAMIMATLVSLLLIVLGVDFAPIIGIFSGLANLIPYFGAFIAFIISVTVTLLSGHPVRALYVAIGIIILQQLDGMVIQPRVVGRQVEMSPLMVLLSLAVAGTLFGLVGMLLAVPVCAIIKMLLARMLARKKQRNEERASLQNDAGGSSL